MQSKTKFKFSAKTEINSEDIFIISPKKVLRQQKLNQEEKKSEEESFKKSFYGNIFYTETSIKGVAEFRRPESEIRRIRAEQNIYPNYAPTRYTQETKLRKTCS